jgi:hypothetical protein
VFLSSPLFSDPFKTLVGDYDGNGEVNASDYAVWKANSGDTTLLTADGNGDQIVDGADYVVWRKNLGRTWLNLAPGSGTVFLSVVPEPHSVALLFLPLAWNLNRRQRR